MTTSSAAEFIHIVKCHKFGGQPISAAELVKIEANHGLKCSYWFIADEQKQDFRNLITNVGIPGGELGFLRILWLCLKLLNPFTKTVVILHSGRAVIPSHIKLLKKISFGSGKKVLTFLHGPSDLEKDVLEREKEDQIVKSEIVDAILVPSTAEKDVQVNLGVSESRVFAIPNIIKEGAFKRDESEQTQKPKETPFIFCCGRIVDYKGVFELLEAFRRIHTDYPETNLVYAGEGEAMDELKEAASDLDDRVEILGQVTNVIDFYKSALFFVTPTYAESFGRTAVEAGKCKAPMALSRIEPWITWFKDEKDVLFFEIQDVDSLEKALRHLLDNPEQANEMAEHAYKTLQQVSDEKVTLKAILSVFKSLGVVDEDPANC